MTMVELKTPMDDCMPQTECQWERMGVAIVRRGAAVEVADDRLHLLLEPNQHAHFDPAPAIARLESTCVDTVRVRTRDSRTPHYVERVLAGADSRLVRIERCYPNTTDREIDVVLTRDRDLARSWANGRRALPEGDGAVTVEADSERAPIHIRRRPGKRVFDIVVSLLVLLVTLPLYPIIALLIRLEDGGPLIFAHERQTLGGRVFSCFKFRTMCRDAESMKVDLAQRNGCDGPHFRLVHDPRLLSIGRWLRRFHLDELPQFYNVLRGDMQIIGPRPSPDLENRFCPAWREVRLSIRPGITGLWQVRRTRRPYLDFQEWIRHDLEYIERQNWRLDLFILWRTLLSLLRRSQPSDVVPMALRSPSSPDTSATADRADAATPTEYRRAA